MDRHGSWRHWLRAASQTGHDTGTRAGCGGEGAWWLKLLGMTALSIVEPQGRVSHGPHGRSRREGEPKAGRRDGPEVGDSEPARRRRRDNICGHIIGRGLERNGVALVADPSRGWNGHQMVDWQRLIGAHDESLYTRPNRAPASGTRTEQDLREPRSWAQ